MQNREDPPIEMRDFIEKIDRRDFIRKGAFLLAGLGASSFFRLGKSFYDEYSIEDLAEIKMYDKQDRNENKKFPSMDVFDAFCNKKNHNALEKVLLEHDTKLSKMKKVHIEQRDLNEVIGDCTGIVSEITGFDINEAHDIKEMESKGYGNFYEYLAAACGGVLLSYLTDRYKLTGNKSLPASRLIAFGSGVLFGETINEIIVNNNSTITGYFGNKDEMAIKDIHEIPLDVIAHELGHLVFHITKNSDRYGAAVNEGFCEGVSNIATSKYDRKRGTVHNIDSETKTTNRLYGVYDVVSELGGYPKQKGLVVKYRRPSVLPDTKKTLSIHEVGCALFQVLESEEGEALYRNLVKGHDIPLERFIYAD
jgi:hypothetical protein